MDNQRVQIYLEIAEELRKISAWAAKKSEPERFDLDSRYSAIYSKYGISIDYGILKHIYNLVDVLCDNIRHDIADIKEDYATSDASRDLNHIIDLIGKQQIDKLEGDFKLRGRLLRIYDS